MVYYLKILVLIFVWKWKIVIMTYFVSLWKSCNNNFSNCYSPVLLNHCQYRWIKMNLSVFSLSESPVGRSRWKGKESTL